MSERDDLMYAAAERHFVLGETMESIARSLGVSRSTVSRLVAAARAEGIVRVTMVPRASESPLARRLADAFGVRIHLVSVPDAAPPGARLDAVARKAAHLLGSRVTDDTRLGVAWGVTVAHVCRQLEKRPLSGVRVVQTNGSINAADSAVPYVGGILAVAADAFGGRVVPFPAPAFFDHASTREALWAESSVRRILDEQARLDVAIFGVGSLRASVPSRVYTAGYFDADTLAGLERLGVVGDICTIMLREDGTWADLEVNRRASGMTPDDLARVPSRLCVVADPLRAPAVLGALRAGVVTDLVCDEGTARAVDHRASL